MRLNSHFTILRLPDPAHHLIASIPPTHLSCELFIQQSMLMHIEPRILTAKILFRMTICRPYSVCETYARAHMANTGESDVLYTNSIRSCYVHEWDGVCVFVCTCVLSTFYFRGVVGAVHHMSDRVTLGERTRRGAAVDGCRDDADENAERAVQITMMMINYMCTS